MSKRAIKRAIRIAGGERQLAEKIGSSPQLVRYWHTFSKKGVAANMVLKVEAVTGVSRHDLRPDVFPREDAA